MLFCWKKSPENFIFKNRLDHIKVRGPFVQTLCIEKEDSYMDAI